MLKTALACNNPYKIGGQGYFLAHAATGLSQLSDLTVFCAGDDVPQTPFSVFPVGFSSWTKLILSTPWVRRRSDWATLLSDLYFDKQVSEALQVDRFDLLIGIAGQSDRSLSTARSLGARVWLCCLNTYLPFMQQQIQQELEYLQDPSIATMHPRILERFLQECQNAELILLYSEIAKQTFIKAGVVAEKLAAIAPPIDCIRFQPSPKVDTTFRVMYVGTIAPRKGVHYLISAFLQAQISDAELLLVGGAATRALRILVENTLSKHANIKQEFWDFSHQDPRQVFGRCSVLVLPSVEDGFGYVVLEAMACGLPVIVTSHCGAADVVVEGINGFVVPPRNVDAIAEKLTLLAEDEAKRIAMAKAARITAQQYTQDYYNSELKKIFRDRELIN